eukprot:scaffold1839_cov382-Prasinococcus_capsulatus_cf.AAC.1
MEFFLWFRKCFRYAFEKPLDRTSGLILSLRGPTIQAAEAMTVLLRMKNKRQRRAVDLHRNYVKIDGLLELLESIAACPLEAGRNLLLALIHERSLINLQDSCMKLLEVVTDAELEHTLGELHWKVCFGIARLFSLVTEALEVEDRATLRNSGRILLDSVGDVCLFMTKWPLSRRTCCDCLIKLCESKTVAQSLFSKHRPDGKHFLSLLVNSLFKSAVYDIQYQALQLLFGTPDKVFHRMLNEHHNSSWPSKSVLMELRQKASAFDKFSRLVLNDLNEANFPSCVSLPCKHVCLSGKSCSAASAWIDFSETVVSFDIDRPSEVNVSCMQATHMDLKYTVVRQATTRVCENGGLVELRLDLDKYEDEETKGVWADIGYDKSARPSQSDRNRCIDVSFRFALKHMGTITNRILPQIRKASPMMRSAAVALS